MIERLEPLLIDMIESELHNPGISGMTGVRALLLFNIGDGEFSAGDLITQKIYLGTNVSHNLNKLVRDGYIDRNRSAADLRIVRVKLTDKGKSVAKMVEGMLTRQASLLGTAGIDADHLDIFNRVSAKIEHFWKWQA
jgi:DNA-binding MarR family transcriptional regulator